MNTRTAKDIFDLSKETDKLAEYYGKESRDWQAAHIALIADVRREYQHFVNTTFKHLGFQLSELENGWDFKKKRELGPIVRQAESELRHLQQQSTEFSEKWRGFGKKLQSLKSHFPHASNELVRSQRDKTRGSGDWVLLFGILLICIVLEATVNMSLLASALTTGLIGAFVIAVLVSFLNVGVVGGGGGLFFNHALSQPKKKELPSIVRPVLWVAWVLVALLLNIFFGRHRENFARIIEQNEAAAEEAYEGVAGAFASATENVTNISWNVLDWQFESVLFLLLGMGLSIFAFYKTFTFAQPAERDFRTLGEELDKLDLAKTKIEDQFHSLPERFHKMTGQLRTKVSGYVQELTREYGKAKVAFEDLQDDWEKNHIIDAIEAKFVMFHNSHHPDKIDLEELKKHRQDRNIDTSFPATNADHQHLEDARKFLEDWSARGKDVFFRAIGDARQQIDSRREDYRQPILGQLN